MSIVLLTSSPPLSRHQATLPCNQTQQTDKHWQHLNSNYTTTTQPTTRYWTYRKQMIQKYLLFQVSSLKQFLHYSTFCTLCWAGFRRHDGVVSVHDSMLTVSTLCMSPLTSLSPMWPEPLCRRGSGSQDPHTGGRSRSRGRGQWASGNTSDGDHFSDLNNVPGESDTKVWWYG